MSGRGWEKTAEELAAGAERARQAGDVVASLALAIKAAECLQAARAFEDMDRAAAALDEARAHREGDA